MCGSVVTHKQKDMDSIPVLPIKMDLKILFRSDLI